MRDRTGPLLRLEDLTDEELQLLAQDFYRRLGEERVGKTGPFGAEELHRIYSSVLHQWGVMCPHPLEMRDYTGLGRRNVIPSFDDSRWFNCGACGCLVINR